MKVTERSVMRLLAVQHLRAAYGIKIKNWNKNKAAGCKNATSSSTKVFGVSMESLPYYNMECGSVPSFLVDACMKLLAHVDTEGLFRKSGSVTRLKALRAKLDAGEECLSAALPCDVAGLVKQFFRELPEPAVPTELHEALLKAQQLATERERTSATVLLSCVLPDRNLNVLRYFFNFLLNVSKRSAENKMDSNNLSVILAPNLLHSGDGADKMNANTERRLKLQAAIVHCFIENAHSFGVLPQCLAEKVPATMGCETGVLSPTHDDLEELDVNSGMKRRCRRSFGDMVSGALNKIKTNRTPTHATQSDSLVFSSATPVIATPASKRKLPLESGHSFGFSNKKRRSVKKSLGIDLLPNALFNVTSSPGSVYSASGVLDSPQTTLSSAGPSRRQSATSARRKSRRLSSRHAVSRVESGRAGCFSPKAAKKEAPRKSLRLRFSLGKSSKDAGSESIGWRLATQESATSFRFTKETEFSPSVLPRKAGAKSSKYISKSEDNLLTPHCDGSAHRTPWSGETPLGAAAFGGGSFTDTPMSACLKGSYSSEPAIVASKPPASSSLPRKLCCASSAESLESESPPALLRAEARHEPRPAVQQPCYAADANAAKPLDSFLVPPPATPAGRAPPADTSSLAANDGSVTFGQIEVANLSPLHIDSAVFERAEYGSPPVNSAPTGSHNGSVAESDGGAEQGNCSRLIDALDIQSPAHFKLGVSSGLQSTPYKLDRELATPRKMGAGGPAARDGAERSPRPAPAARAGQPLSPRSLETEKRRVADHIQHFNMLTLHSPRGSRGKQARSPLRFQRTPVRQTVRRMNSLLGESRRPARGTELHHSQSRRVGKATSLESGLSPHPRPQPHHGEALVGVGTCPKKKPPPVPPKRQSTLPRKPEACALGDVTNKVQAKTKADRGVPEPPGPQRPLPQQVVQKDTNHYRGSPRNPLNQGRLLAATKPVDL